jgi:hypothetical protein
MDRQAVSSRVVLSVAGIACAASCSFGGSVPRVMMHPDSELVSAVTNPIIFADRYQPNKATVSKDHFAAMRAMGADLELVRGDERQLDLSVSGFTAGTVAGVESIGESIDPLGAGLNSDSNMRFFVGRNTTLNDGNIAGSSSSLPGQEGSVSTMTQSEGEYNFYDMMVEWEAASSGPVVFSLTSGVTAIEANVSKKINSGGTSGLYDVTNRVIAVPTIGSAVKWNISRNWSLTGKATTQSFNMGSSLIGFNAQTDWRVSDRVGISAGYQILRSEFDLGAVTTDLNQEGLFARLSIQF